MAIYGLCLSVLFACFIVGTPFVQGRSLRRRHDRHSRADYYDYEKSMPRILSRRLEDNTDRRLSHGYRQILDRSAEENSAEVRIPYSSHRYVHEYGSRGRDTSRRHDDDNKNNDDDVVFEAPSTTYVARRKRHNKHGGTVSYHRFTEREKKNLFVSRQRNHELELLQSDIENGGIHAAFELEVKEAQNSSICNYTVESIRPDPTRGNRVPKDLEHIRCNHVGSSCQGAGTYCCIQTYRNIEVFYGDGDKETMKIYVGCVCAALQDLNGLRVIETQLPIKD